MVELCWIRMTTEGVTDLQPKYPIKRSQSAPSPDRLCRVLYAPAVVEVVTLKSISDAVFGTHRNAGCIDLRDLSE